MNIDIQFIPHSEHRFTTIGYWFVENETLTIQISKEISWQNKIATIFHELIEAGICIKDGITTAQCDAFDELFEQEYQDGLWPVEKEAGFDRRCPYRKGHVWGHRMERIVMFLLGVDWNESNEECLRLMENKGT